MTWEKGKSGNPTGRPQKNRAWTAILEKAGNKRIEVENGKSVTRKELMADLIMQGITSGRITFPDKTKIELTPREWLDLLWKAYGQVDGPPRLDVDVTTDGEKINSPQVFLPPVDSETDDE